MLLLTGANGLTGQSVLQEANKNNIPVKIIIRNRQNANQNMRKFTKVGDLSKLVRIDYRLFLRDVTQIIHTATSTNYDSKLFINDLIILKNLIKLNLESFVYCSSQSIYGTGNYNYPITEEDVYKPENWYQNLKCSSEQMLKSYKFSNPDFEYKIFRIPLIFSGSRSKSFQVLDYYLENIYKGVDFYFDCNEDQASNYGTSWISASDLAKILLHANNIENSVTLNISSGFISFIELITKLINLLNSKSKLYFNSPLCRGGIKLMHSRRLLDTTKAREYQLECRDNIDDVLEAKCLTWKSTL